MKNTLTRVRRRAHRRELRAFRMRQAGLTYRAIGEKFGLCGNLGDNDVARCILACETASEEITMRPSSENQSIDYEMAKLRTEIERLRDFARQVELNTREGPPLTLKLNWMARRALAGAQEGK